MTRRVGGKEIDRKDVKFEWFCEQIGTCQMSRFQELACHLMNHLWDTSAKAYSRPVWLVVESVSNPDVTLAGVDGTTADGKYYIDLSTLLGDGKLDLGESISKLIYFNKLKRRRFNCSMSVRDVVIDGMDNSEEKLGE